MEMEIIKTTDISLASTLLAMGFDVIGIDNFNPKKVQFLFNQTPDLISNIAEYWRGSKMYVSPLAISNSRRELLTRMNEMKI